MSDPVTDRQDIEQFLRESLAAWNGGDLERLMQRYEESPQTTLIVGDQMTRGFDAIRAGAIRFLASNPDPASAGRIDSLDIRMLGTDHALLTATLSWVDAGGTQQGLATMIVRCRQGAWRFVFYRYHALPR